MKTGTGFEAYSISRRGTKYLDLIEAGVVLEDAVYPHHDNDGDGTIRGQMMNLNPISLFIKFILPFF